MNIFKLIIASFVIALLAPSAALAQLGGVAPLPQIKKSSGPSLEDTTQWITQKLETLIGVVTEGSSEKYVRRTQWAFDGCNAHLVVSTEPALPSGITRQPLSTDFSQIRYDLNSFKLNELDLEAIKTWPKNDGRADLNLMAAGERRTILHTTISQQGVRAYGQYRTEVDKTILSKQLEILKTSRDSYDHPTTWPLTDVPGWNFTRFDTSFVKIPLPDMDIAERLGTAFRRAVTLCQERTAAEKMARPVKPKELF